MNALDVLHGLRLDDGRSWGEVATDVQRADAAAILDTASPRRFHFVSRSRGYSKTTDLAAVAIAVLLAQAPPGSRSYAAAADQGQARFLLDAVERFVRATPGLHKLLDLGEQRLTVRSTGATLDALAADAAGTWGLLPFFVVVDELAEWGSTGAPKRIWEALSSAIPKTGGRLAAITTAGSPGHWAKRVRDHAAADPVWRLSETEGPPPWMDRDLLDEQRRRLLPATFARLFENLWTAGSDALVADDDLAACVTLDGPLPPQRGPRYVLGLDIGVTRDRTAGVVCHAERVTRPTDELGGTTTVGQRVILDRLRVWRGSREQPVVLDEVEEWVREVCRSYHPCEVVADPFQAVGMLQRLGASGINAHAFTFTASSVGRLAVALHGALSDRRLDLPDDEELLDELANVRIVETSPNRWRLDHAADRHDDRAIALALCVEHLADHASYGDLRASTGTSPDLSFDTFGPPVSESSDRGFL